MNMTKSQRNKLIEQAISSLRWFQNERPPGDGAVEDAIIVLHQVIGKKYINPTDTSHPKGDLEVCDTSHPKGDLEVCDTCNRNTCYKCPEQEDE
jgi:hypothetical protein